VEMRQTLSRVVLLALLAGSLLVDAAPAQAHELGVVRARLLEVGPALYALEARLPPIPEFTSQLPTLPARCRVSGGPTIQARPAWIDMRLEFDCRGSRLTGADTIALPWPNHGAFFSADLRTGSTPGRFFAGYEQGAIVTLSALTESDERGATEIGRHYLLLGIEHILTGWDHLAFVLMLCLVAAGWRLLGLVSAFTAGHSLTLALAALGFVRVPAAPVEAAIALSVAFLAREALREGEDTLQHGAALVFGFGLLHGLGFASALQASGIARAEFYVGLLTFNLGVEIGQLMFVALVVGLAAAGHFAGMAQGPRRTISAAAAYAVGVLGVYWTLQRTL
jgi:hypothetical protein